MIRIATKEDAKALLDIYKYYVEQTTITFEYETPSVEEFERRIENTLKKYPYLVEEEDGKIYGYTYAGPFKERAAYDWSVETTIYVDKDARGKGIGKKLFQAVAQEAVNRGCQRMEWTCLDWNQPSIEFYLRMGAVPMSEWTNYRLSGDAIAEAVKK